MKALILAGGRGKRLGELTKDRNKCTLEIAGKPIIEYNLDRAADIEKISEIIIVVGHMADDIINAYGNSYRGKKITYVLQPEQRGLVHAIECAKSAIGKDDFFLLLGDEVLTESMHREMAENFERQNLFAICGVINQPDTEKIGRTYTVIADDNNRIYRLIEKPKKPINEIQGTGHCIFRNAILDYLERTPIHPERGERELPDLIQCAIDEGNIVKTFLIANRYTNINSEEDLNDAREMME